MGQGRNDRKQDRWAALCSRQEVEQLQCRVSQGHWLAGYWRRLKKGCSAIAFGDNWFPGFQNHCTTIACHPHSVVEFRHLQILKLEEMHTVDT